MTDDTVTIVDSGRFPLGHRRRREPRETVPGTTEVTETFDHSTARTPKPQVISGQPAANTTGITNTSPALAERFR